MSSLAFSSQELEFFARDEIISIVPNFSLEKVDPGSASIPCIGGQFGPFRPNQTVAVPLWLALALHKRGKCRLLIPDWLRV